MPRKLEMVSEGSCALRRLLLWGWGWRLDSGQPIRFLLPDLSPAAAFSASSAWSVWRLSREGSCNWSESATVLARTAVGRRASGAAMRESGATVPQEDSERSRAASADCCVCTGYPGQSP